MRSRTLKRILLVWGGLFIALSAMGVVRYSTARSEAAKLTVTDESPLPDVESVVRSSISSVQKQSQLLVLTARMHAMGKSTIKSMGMEAWQIDIATGEAQFLVDLSYLTEKNIVVEGKDITISLPPQAILVKQLPTIRQETNDNGSWLFSLYDETRINLTKANNLKIQQMFLIQAQEKKEEAQTNAAYALTSLLETPIRAAGLTHKIHILFQS